MGNAGLRYKERIKLRRPGDTEQPTTRGMSIAQLARAMMGVNK